MMDKVNYMILISFAMALSTLVLVCGCATKAQRIKTTVAPNGTASATIGTLTVALSGDGTWSTTR